MENAQVSNQQTFDAIVVGGGPSGATVATELARAGYSVMLLDRAGRIKPCGGAIPPRLIEDFDIPDSQIVAKVNSARIISPSAREVDMPVEIGYVGMVDRDVFDEYYEIGQPVPVPFAKPVCSKKSNTALMVWSRCFINPALWGATTR